MTIGDKCLISQFVLVIASNHSIDVPRLIRDAPWNSTRNFLEIRDDVWIGTHAVILPGVRIGRGSVADGAVVADISARVTRFRRFAAELTR